MVAGFDAIVAFAPAFDDHLAFFAAAVEGFDFLVEAEVSLIALGIELAGLDGGIDGAAFVALVFAVAKEALLGEGFDVGEAIAEGVFVGPHLDFTDAGVVDEDAAIGEDDEFAGDGGVAAFAGDFIDFVGPEPVFAEELVDEGGLANAGGANEGEGGAGEKKGAEEFEPFFSEGAGEVDLGGGVEGEDLLSGGLVLGVRVEVGFIEEDEGLGAAFGNQGEETLEAAEVEVGAGIGDNHDEVDVGGEDLFFAAFAGEFSREAGAAWETGADEVFIIFASSEVEGDPISDGREVGIAGGIVPKFPADEAGDFIAAVEEGGEVDFGFADEAGGNPGGLGEFFERGIEEVIPAKVEEGHRRRFDHGMGGKESFVLRKGESLV